MIQGSSQARTARSAAGQERRGWGASSAVLIFPPARRLSDGFGLDGRRAALGGAAVMVPTEGEGAADEDPMPPDGKIRAHLVLAPAERALGLLITLLDPHPEAIQSRHLGQIRWWQGACLP